MAQSFRTIGMKWHRFVGLNMALYFMMMFLTGTTMVFRHEINEFFQPTPAVALVDAPTLGVPGVHSALKDAYDEIAIISISRPDTDTAPYLANVFVPGKGRFIANIDPYDGRVLSETHKNVVTQIIRDIHASLLIPQKIGYLLVSSTSLILLFSLVSGLVSYRRFWKGYLRTPAKDAPGQVKWGGWHRVIALWSTPFLLIMALSGVYFFAKDLGIDGTVPPRPAVSERQTALPDGYITGQLDHLIAATQTKAPDFTLQTVVFPTRADEPLSLKGFAGERGVMASRTLLVDPITQDILAIEAAQNNSGLKRIAPWIVALHFGDWGGLPVKVLWAIFGLMSAGLMAAGLKVTMARVSNQSKAQGQRSVRLWHVLGPVKWLYILAIAGVVAIAMLKYVF